MEDSVIVRCGGCTIHAVSDRGRNLWSGSRQSSTYRSTVLTIGMTGGIGCGKSAVTAVARALGATVADADLIARDILAPGSEALVEICREFGEDLVTIDPLTKRPTLNRAALAARAFRTPEGTQTLNAITHPRIRSRAIEILSHTPAGGVGIYDAPLLLESGMGDLVDVIAVVTAPEEQRYRRLVARGMSEDDARQRMARQIIDRQRLAVADFHVANDGTLSDLTTAAREWLARFVN